MRDYGDDELLTEDDLLDRLAADPSPNADVVLLLLAAKAEGAEWATAWARAMRTAQPPRDLPDDVATLLAGDRGLLRELRPALQASYEDRAMTAAERAETDALVEQRIAA